MGFLGKKWKELVYTLTSNDRYAGYHTSKAVNSLTEYDSEGEEANDAKEIQDNIPVTADEKQQAQLVLDAWHIIEDVINLDMNNPDPNNNHFTLNSKNSQNYDYNYDMDFNLDLEEIPDAEDFMNSLSSPCTFKDLQIAQKHLGVKFPYPVIKYFQTHDGQEVAPSSTKKLGLMYGLQLLSLAEVITMTNYWRKVARKEENSKARLKAKADSISNDSKERPGSDDIINPQDDAIINNDPNFKIAAKINEITENDLKNYPDLMRNMSTHSKTDYLKKLPNQKSFPANKVKLQYASANWIPLVTDNAGNHIAIDLDPDVDGMVGQVIIFGRDYDTKYVVADNWGQFMSKFALDFEDPSNCKLDYDPDLGQFNLVYLDQSGNVVDGGYLEVLTRRVKGERL